MSFYDFAHFADKGNRLAADKRLKLTGTEFTLLFFSRETRTSDRMILPKIRVRSTICEISAVFSNNCLIGQIRVLLFVVKKSYQLSWT